MAKKKIKPKPYWWPNNPYPDIIFPMTVDEYVKEIPDKLLRTRISGCLGRLFWEIASKSIWDAMCREKEIEEDEAKE